MKSLFYCFLLVMLVFENALARSLTISGEQSIVSDSHTVITSEMLEYGAYIVIILVILSMVEPIKKYLSK